MPEKPVYPSHKKAGSDLISMLEPYFTTQAPFQIPTNGREMLVSWLPWINLVGGILCVLAFLPLLGLAGMVSTISAVAGYSTGTYIWIPMLILLAQGVVLLVAFPGLRNNKLSAWKLLFWADVIFFIYNIVSGFVTPSGLISGIVGAIISIVIGMYLLFQIKSYYK